MKAGEGSETTLNGALFVRLKGGTLLAASRRVPKLELRYSRWNLRQDFRPMLRHQRWD